MKVRTEVPHQEVTICNTEEADAGIAVIGAGAIQELVSQDTNNVMDVFDGGTYEKCVEVNPFQMSFTRLQT